MTRLMGYRWKLRHKMAEKGWFQTSDLVGPLAEFGIRLSREQVYRLVTQPPQRLSMDTLAALCGILECSPNDLIEVESAPRQVAKPAVGTDGPPPAARTTTVRRPEGL